MSMPSLDTLIATTKQQIAAVEATAAPLRALLQRQEAAKTRQLASGLVDSMGIRRSEVWRSNEESGAPFFSNAHGFAAWIKSQPIHKRFTERNGRIYLTDSLLAGRFEQVPFVMWEDISE